MNCQQPVRATYWLFHPLLTGRVIVMLMLPSLLFDVMTGWSAMYAPLPISPSQLYRSLMILIMFLWLAAFWRVGFHFFIAVLFFIFFVVAIHGFFAIGFAQIGMCFRFNLSLFTHFFYFLFFYGFLRTIRHSMRELQRFERTVYRIIWFSLAMIAINITLGFFGVGYATLESYAREGEIGSGGGKGFFLAGNDLSSAFLVVVGMFLMHKWSPKHLINYHLYSLFALVLGVMLLTKTAILGILLLIAGLPLCMTRVIHHFSIHFRSLIPLLSGIAMGVGALTWLIYSDSALFRRAIFLYQKADIWTAVTTGRSNFLNAAMQTLSGSYGVIDWLFGKGWDGAQQSIAQYLGFAHTTEIDFVDILLMNGIVGLFLVIAIWFFYLLTALANMRHSRMAVAVLFVDLLLLALGATSGHTLYSAMNGMFVALLNILPLIERYYRLFQR